MGRKIYSTVLVFCLVCIFMRWMIPSSKTLEDGQIDPVVKAKMAVNRQGKLVVLRIFGTTTSYLKDEPSWPKATAQVGYVYDGSADIIVDLKKSKYRYEEEGDSKILHIVAPSPMLDCSTVGIEPSRLRRVPFIPRSSFRRQEVFSNLEDECKKQITDKQRKVFSSVDVIEDAKAQARFVLTAFYRACVSDEIDVDIEFENEEIQSSVNQDVRNSVKIEDVH